MVQTGTWDFGSGSWWEEDLTLHPNMAPITLPGNQSSILFNYRMSWDTHTQRKIKTETDHREEKRARKWRDGTKGKRQGVKGLRELLLRGKTATTNKQQSSVLSCCLSSTSRPLRASSDLWTRRFHTNSPVALFTCCCRCCLRCTLIINIIICLWYCMSSHKSAFLLSFLLV